MISCKKYFILLCLYLFRLNVTYDAIWRLQAPMVVLDNISVFLSIHKFHLVICNFSQISKVVVSDCMIFIFGINVGRNNSNLYYTLSMKSIKI